jgi:archaemetzincin
METSPALRRPRALRLLPIGPLTVARAEDLAARVSRRIAVPCQVDPALPEPRGARLPDRDQLDADALLTSLEARAPADVVLVGVTTLDMGISIFTFVFGRARQGGWAAVVSLARLDPSFYGLQADPKKATQRAVAEILHELGHVAGLRHCEESSCLMRFAASVDQIDIRGSAFCTSCAARLPRWLLARPARV